MAIETRRTLHATPTPPPVPSTRRRLRYGVGAGIGLAAAVVLTVSAFAFSGRRPQPLLTSVVRRGDMEVTITAQGLLESAENEEIKCKVRGRNTVTWVIESGTFVKPGDVLVRLDTRFIEEQIDERTKYAHWSRSAAEQSAGAVRRAELAIEEYQQGRFVEERMSLEKEIVVARARLQSAREILAYTKKLAESGYVNEFEVEEKEFAVRQAQLDLEVLRTQLRVLQDYTKKERLAQLKGEYAAIKATHEANVERAQADASRRDRALEERKHCTVRAHRAGLVIHPNAARWENAPRIYQGATVYKDRVMLLMPNLDKMQVKVGVHEAVIDRVRVGMKARVRLATQTLEGTVQKISSVTRPPGWWTGNEVRYDTIVALPKGRGLRPGMSAEVEIVVAEYEDVVQVPVAAVAQEVVNGKEITFCSVKDGSVIRKRRVTLGDSNGVFTIVQSGLVPGDEVLLNPKRTLEDTGSGSQDGGGRKRSPGSRKLPK